MSDNKKNFIKKKEKQFAENLIQSMKESTAPFLKPWKAGELLLPYNPFSNNKYQGKNILRCFDRGFFDPRFLTFNQIKKMELKLRKGAKASSLCFFSVIPKTSENRKEGEVIETYNMLKYFSVFNASDINGIEEYKIQKKGFINHKIAEKIISASQAPIFHDMRDKAFYNLSNDEIHLPKKEFFDSEEDYYSVAIHEIAHSTGHKNRLDRPFGVDKESPAYAFEELIAQITSYMLACYLSLPHNPKTSFNYLNVWLSRLEKDYSLILKAVKEASKIVDLLLTDEMKKEVTK